MIEQFYNSTVQQSNNQTFQQINNSTIQQFNNSEIQQIQQHGRSCLSGREGGRPPWRTKIQVFTLFWRNKMKLGGSYYIIARPP